jgi:hypothetical protein
MGSFSCLRFKQGSFVLVTGLTAVFLAAGTAQAKTYSLVGTVGTSARNLQTPRNWQTPTNWSPTGVPGLQDTVIIGANVAVETSEPVSVLNLTMNPGSRISGKGSVRVSGVGNFNDAHFSSGDVVIESEAVVNITSSGTSSGSIASVSGVMGAINMRFDGKLYNHGTINWSSGNLLASKGFYQAANSTLNITGDGCLAHDSAAGGTAEIQGKVRKSSNGISVFALPVNNRGHIEAAGGILDFANGFKQFGGTTLLNGGSIGSKATLQYLGGRLAGSGTVQGSVNNQGATVAPGHSPGIIVVNGGYVQAANGILQMEIGGTTPGTGYDQLQVNGSATLDGTLDMIQYANFVPVAGNSFQLLKYLSVSGDFATVLNDFTNVGTYFTTSKTPSYLVAQTNADASAPSISIAAPQLYQASSSVTTAYGTASDTISGLSKVTVRLFRYANTSVTAGYWNGSGWTSGYSPANNELPATGTTSWSWSLPTLAEGKYCVFATAKDKANNATTTAGNIFWIDTTVPDTATITSPVHNTLVTDIDSVTGSASDTGSGVVRVDLRIKKTSDNTYWNGTAWVATVTNLTTAFSGSSWSRNHSTTMPMPTGAALPDEVYMITALAVDRANLVKAAVATVRVQSSG